MKLKDRVIAAWESLTKSEPKSEFKAPVDAWYYPDNRINVQTHSFDGEKNLGESGPLIEYRLAYNDLRTRSWAAMLTSDKAQIGVNRLLTWVIGKGLKP